MIMNIFQTPIYKHKKIIFSNAYKVLRTDSLEELYILTIFLKKELISSHA